jgi:DNA-binding winged helix-turn-helix (wHTH) protein
MANIAHPGARTYRFGDVVVECANFRVLVRDRAVSLEPRAFDVLVYLIEHAGRAVQKQELFENVWKDTFVTDGTLTRIVNQIRHAIGDDPMSPQYIETVHKHGYRFIAKVRICTAPFDSPSEEESAERDDLLAILPFSDLGGGGEQDVLAAGITELLITYLSTSGCLQVIPRLSVIAHDESHRTIPEIGRDLNARALVVGTVLRIGDQVRITAQVVDAATDRIRWATSYEGDASDILAMQRDVARSIAVGVRLALGVGTSEPVTEHLRPVAVRQVASPEPAQGTVAGRTGRRLKGIARAVDRDRAILEQRLMIERLRMIAYELREKVERLEAGHSPAATPRRSRTKSRRQPDQAGEASA